jgi:hypothetical protein
LSDPKRRIRVALGLALAYALVWALYATVAKSSQGINVDMGEMLVWVREPALGYPKHPPFLAWELAAWFAIFPLADWSYYLLSGLNLGIGLFAAFVLAGEWLTGVKRAAVPFLLAVIPFYNFLGLKFDQNSALIPLWAFTTWAFVRSLDSRSNGYAVLAGLLAAACMLSKYWSVFLLLALGLAALCDRRRGAYFRAPAPYVTALVAAAAFAPHAYWLVREHFPPMTWVTTRRTSESLADALRSLSEYSFGTLGYASVAILMVLLLVQPSWRALRDGMWPRDDADRRTAAILFWTPLIVPIAVAFATRTNLLSLWNTPALNLLPVILLGSPLIAVSREQVARMASVAITVSLLALAAAPIVAFAAFRTGVENYAVYSREVAAALDREWQRSTDRPLRLVGGPFVLVSSVAMYGRDRPSTFADFSPYLSPWATADRIARQGIAVVCPRNEPWCVERLNAMAGAGGRTVDVVLTPHWLGFAGAPQDFVFAIIPPRMSSARTSVVNAASTATLGERQSERIEKDQRSP